MKLCCGFEIRTSSGQFQSWRNHALSGNEGYSFGPHLHMEIRCTDTGELIDPLQFYTDKIKDTTPPRASMIMLYPQRGAGVVEGSQRKKSIPVASLGQPVSAWGKIAAGIKAYDYMDGTHNNYGVRSWYSMWIRQKFFAVQWMAFCLKRTG